MARVAPLPLSPIDHLFIGRAISIALLYPGPLDEERLTASLASVRQALPPLGCGLVELEGARQGLAPLPSSPGLELREAQRLPDELADPRSLDELLPRLTRGPEQPLLRSRLTRAPSGSVLGVTVSHALADGHGAFTLLRTWSRALLGRPIEPPPWDRRLLAVSPPPAAALTPEDVWRRTGFCWKPGGGPRGPLRPAAFGARRVPPEPGLLADDRSLSDNDRLCAWIIQTYARELAGPEGLAVSFPIDYRRLLGIPKGYFGNAVRGAPLWLDRTELERATIPELAAQVQQAIRGVLDERSARSSLECLEQLLREQGPQVLDELHLADPRRGLVVTNVSHLPFALLDFGAGPPLQALLPAVEERTAAIQQTDAGFELSVLSAPA